MVTKERSVRLSPKAEQDLEAIWRYTAENWSVAQADRYTKLIFEAFNELAMGSAVGRKASARNGYFKFPVGSHFIFYREDSGSQLDVIRILHQSMDAERHLS